jgi:hypothetical protein
MRLRICFESNVRQRQLRSAIKRRACDRPGEWVDRDVSVDTANYAIPIAVDTHLRLAGFATRWEMTVFSERARQMSGVAHMAKHTGVMSRAPREISLMLRCNTIP